MNPPLANDPVTHIPFPKADWKWKMANYFLEKWGRKLTMKILQAAQPVIMIIVGKIANTTESEQVISIAIGAAILGVIDMVISWVTGGKLQSLQKIQEEAEADEYDKQPRPSLFGPNGFAKPFVDPAPTMTNIPPLGMQDAATSKAIREVKTRSRKIEAIKIPQYVVRHRSAAKGSRWIVNKFHDREIAQSRFDTLVATKKDGLVEITGPGIP